MSMEGKKNLLDGIRVWDTIHVDGLYKLLIHLQSRDLRDNPKGKLYGNAEMYKVWARLLRNRVSARD